MSYLSAYTDHHLDTETALLYMNARYYDPELKRFTSVDPWAGDATRPQSFNKFSYTENNPINHNDPTGMFSEGAGLASMAFNALVHAIRSAIIGGSVGSTVDSGQQIYDVTTGNNPQSTQDFLRGNAQTTVESAVLNTTGRVEAPLTFAYEFSQSESDTFGGQFTDGAIAGGSVLLTNRIDAARSGVPGADVSTFSPYWGSGAHTQREIQNGLIGESIHTSGDAANNTFGSSVSNWFSESAESIDYYFLGGHDE